jgi:hypothetical protein
VGEPAAERIRIEIPRPVGGAAAQWKRDPRTLGASQHAPIDERDIAAVAVEALLTDRLLGQKAPLTEPRSQSARELADTLAGHGCRCFLYGCRWTVTSVYPMDRLS